MTAWHPRLVATSRAKYLGIVDALEQDIASGQIKPGASLPSQRAVAQALGVDLTTVTRAFTEARQRGLIAATPGRGTYVMPDRDGASRPVSREIDLGMNNPAVGAVPELMAGLADTLQALIADDPSALNYRGEPEQARDLAMGLDWLRPRLGDVPARRARLSAGGQAALFAIFHLLCRKGDRIAVPEFVYPGMRSILQTLGLSALGIATDKDGIVPEAFAEACRKDVVRAIYLTPVIDNPTTATLPEARRLAIVATAREHDVKIVEDDPYGALASVHLPSFVALAPELSWHVATVSKVLSPAMRVAYVVAPSVERADQLSETFRATQLFASPLTAGLVARWIEDGTAGRVRERIVKENIERQKLARSLLAPPDTGATLSADPAGPHLWLQLPARWRAADFTEAARRDGIRLVPASEFAIGPSELQAVRLSLGTPRDRDTLKQGLTRLSGILSGPGFIGRTVV